MKIKACEKCHTVHKTFKNGNVRKTCPCGPQQGEGILDDIVSRGSKIARGVKGVVTRGLVPSLHKRPHDFEQFLKNYGDLKVFSINVCRTNVKGIYQTLLNFLGMGQWNRVIKKYNYDSVFHLWLELRLSNGKTLYLEKNQRWTWGYGYGGKKTTNKSKKCLHADPNGIQTLNEIFDKLEQKMGNWTYRYSPSEKNCQNLVQNIVHVLNIHKLDNFISQQTIELMPKWLGKVAQGVTDTAAIAENIWSGGKKGKKPKKK